MGAVEAVAAPPVAPKAKEWAAGAALALCSARGVLPNVRAAAAPKVGAAPLPKPKDGVGAAAAGAGAPKVKADAEGGAAAGAEEPKA